MNRLTGRQPTDLAAQKRLFWMAAALLLLALLAFLGQARSKRLLEKTRDDLARAESGLARLQTASAERKKALTALKSQKLPSDAKISPEVLLYRAVDELKARFSPDSLTVSAVERKANEVSLGYSLKYLNPNYSNFLNIVGYLESCNVPSSQVNAVEIVRDGSNGKAEVSCSVTGRLLTSAQGGP